MAFEPSCCELNDCLQCAGLREEMSSTWNYLDTLFSSKEFQRQSVELDHPGISTSHDQERRRLDLGQYVTGKVRAPTPRNHSADAITDRASRDKCGGRARARSEQSNGQPAYIWFLDNPAHRMNQASAEKLDVEDILPVIFFLGQKKVEQQSCGTSMIKRSRNLSVAWAETARTAAMGEDNQGPGSSRTRQSTCQAERRNLHISRESPRLSLALSITAERGNLWHGPFAPLNQKNAIARARDRS
jgi:hypothetical protein